MFIFTLIPLIVCTIVLTSSLELTVFSRRLSRRAQAIMFHSHCTLSYLNSLFIFIVNRPFYQYGGHIEFIIFMEYYGMPRGHSLSIYTGVFGKMRTSMTIFIGKKAIIITSKKGTTIFFSHYNLFLGKLKEKIGPKSAHKYCCKYIGSCSCPLGIL